MMVLKLFECFSIIGRMFCSYFLSIMIKVEFSIVFYIWLVLFSIVMNR